jgi:hypothetical protein
MGGRRSEGAGLDGAYDDPYCEIRSKTKAAEVYPMSRMRQQRASGMLMVEESMVNAFQLTDGWLVD